MHYHLGSTETLALALLVLLMGYTLNRKVAFLREYNIPEPVVGGIVFALLTAILYLQFGFSLSYEMDLKNPLMLVFFTTVGLGASLKLLVKGGPKVLLFLGVATLYLLCQNFIGVLIAGITGLNPLAGLLSGSITLSGGARHGCHLRRNV